MPASLPAAPTRILIINDDIGQQKMVHDFLVEDPIITPPSFTLTIPADPTALRQAMQEVTDLVLLDYALTRWQHLQPPTAEEIVRSYRVGKDTKEIRLNRNPAILLLSAYTDHSEVRALAKQYTLPLRAIDELTRTSLLQVVKALLP